MVYVPTGRPRGRPRKDGLPPQSKKGAVSIPAPKKRGRKPKAKNEVVIGAQNGVMYKFPIVQEDTNRKPVTTLIVGDFDFPSALAEAVRWAVEYSKTTKANYWPLVRYKEHSDPRIGSQKRYVKRIGGQNGTLAYAENHEVGSWLHLDLLEVI